MDNYLTVKEFAAAANVTTQRIYKLYAMGCTTKCNGIATELHEYFKIENGKKYIHRDALRLFENATELQAVTQPFETALAAFEKQLEVMQQQLAEKDKQLSEANTHIAELTATIKAAQEEQANLTAALKTTQEQLTAAQALHAGTIQQQLTEQQEPQQESADDQTEAQQELNFFQRLRNFLIHRG